MNDFILNIIYEKEKDNIIQNSLQFYKRLKDKYKINENIQPELYKRIINYQIDKYGGSLNYISGEYTKEDLDRIRVNANARKTYKRNYKIRRRKENEEK